MGLNYVLGGAGSGKTEFCKSRIKETAEKFPNRRVLYIVPEQFTLNGEYLMTELLGGAILNTDVVSFKRLAYNVFSEVGIKDLPILDPVGKSIVLRKVISDLRENGELLYFDKASVRSGFIEKISSTVSEFVHYCLDEKKLDLLIEDAKERTSEENAVVLKYRDLKTIYSAYNAFIDNQYISAESTPDYLAAYIEKSEKLKGTDVYIDSFSGFSPQEISVIASLLRKCSNVYVSLCIPDMAENSDGFFCEPVNAVRKLSAICEEAGIAVKTVFNGGGRNKRQRGALAEFSENWLSYSRTVLLKKGNGDLSAVCADNMYSEISCAANEIAAVTREKKATYSEIAVILGDTSYLPVVKNIFGKFGISYFADNKIAAFMHPLARLIISFLKIYIYNFKYEDVFNFLKTGFFDEYEGLGRDNIYELENFVLAYNKNGMKQYRREWPERKAYKNTEAVRRIICDLLIEDKNIKLSGANSGYEYKAKNITKKILDLLRKVNVKETLEKWCTNEETEIVDPDIHRQIWDIVNDIAMKIDDILQDTKVTAKTYCECFEDALKSTSIGFIPASPDAVSVGDMSRSRFADTKYLFILGANDGFVPPIVRDTGFISDAERKWAMEKGISLAADSSHIVKHNEFLIYSALSLPREKLWVGYSLSTLTGVTRLPAMLVKKLEAISGVEKKNVTKDNIYVASEVTAEEAFLKMAQAGSGSSQAAAMYSVIKEKYPDFLSMINEMSEKLRQKNNLSGVTEEFLSRRFSVSQIETFRACRFMYFAKYILALKAREYGFVDSINIGNAQHGILQRVFEFLRKAEDEGKFDWDKYRDDPEGLQREMNGFISSAVTSYKESEEYNEAAFDISGKNDHIFRRIERIAAITASAAAANLNEAGFRPYMAEMDFNSEKRPFKITTSDGHELKFGGRIDRIDVYTDSEGEKYIRIIDYKSSEKYLKVKDIELGIQIQLLTYLNEFLKMKKRDSELAEAKPAGAFYMKVYEKDIKIDNISTDIEGDIKKMYDEYKLNGIVANDPEIKAAMKKSIGKQAISADEAEFKRLFTSVEDTIRTSCEEITEGRIEAEPTEDSEGALPCRYCDYYPLCGKDMMEI